MKAHKLPAMFGSFVDDYRNAEFIQETLLRKYVYVPKGNIYIFFAVVNNAHF
jgi:hypothetical protein